MLKLKKIIKIYKTGDTETKALNGISLNFGESEFVAILGESGSGKTTLLNVIGGLDHYDHGDLIINGISTKKYKDKDWDAYRNYQVGFVFQNYHLIPHQNILSNVELALTLSGINSHERKHRAKEALKSVGLEEHCNKMPNQLSGGQMQRVAIARALVNNPSIIFADEPTGALDTKTSVQIMDILKEVSKNKLVVMVTHNPKLAKQYATRIVNLSDGKIVGDHPNVDAKNRSTNTKSKFILSFKKNKQSNSEMSRNDIDSTSTKSKKTKTAMSFLTALQLSFANLMGKKGRTLLTAFAGSIGIIGIAGILSLSNGTHLYINQVENNTLAQYPINITKNKSIISGLGDAAESGSLNTQIEKLTTNQNEGESVGVRSTLSLLLGGAGSNDLKSLKEYLETNPNNLAENTKSIEYTYNTQPLIYNFNNENAQQVYPNKVSSNLSGTGISSGSTSGTSSITSKYSVLTDFFQMPNNDEIYKDKYNLATGNWPENNYECVVVLHQDGTISDSLLYTLGLRDNKELEEAIMHYSRKEDVSLPSEYDNVSYDKIIGKKFKLVCQANLYQHNSENNTWLDMSENQDYVNNIVRSSKDMTIVGIVEAPQGNSTSLTLSAGINYPYELNEECISEAAQTEIVQQQLSNPSIDVLTGKPFGTDSQEINKDSFSDIIKIDKDAINNLFSDNKSGLGNLKSLSNIDALTNIDMQINQEDLIEIISSSITEEDIKNLVEQIATDQSMSTDLQKCIVLAVNSYIDYMKTHPSETIEHYFSKEGEGYIIITQACAALTIDISPIIIENISTISKKITTNLISTIYTSLDTSISNFKNNITNMMEAYNNIDFNLDISSDALLNIFKINLTKEKLVSIAKLVNGSNTRTYESNLSNFGYADISNPTSITMYPSNFNAKNEITNTINEYNSEQPEEKQISYTDYAKLLMTSITTMIDMITAVLIAFVAISLVVSSIMIGIITYISVLERRKEIGILRAIGARKRDVFRVFNAETFIVGTIAGVIGIVITIILCFPANMLAYTYFNTEYDVAILPFWAAISLILISIVLTLIAGLIPSVSASQKDPVEAINS